MASQAFIDAVVPSAQTVQRQTGMFASVTIAQGIWESAGGLQTPHDITTGIDSFNLFGRKAAGLDPFVTSWTHEWVNGSMVQVQARFKKYLSYDGSILDRCTFLKLPWYARACAAGNPMDAVAFLIDTGVPGYSYATDPNYVAGVQGVIRSYGLTAYDLPKEADYMLSVADKDEIINTWIGPAWNKAKEAGDQQQMDEIHRLANELRKAAGCPIT